MSGKQYSYSTSWLSEKAELVTSTVFPYNIRKDSSEAFDVLCFSTKIAILELLQLMAFTTIKSIG